MQANSVHEKGVSTPMSNIAIYARVPWASPDAIHALQVQVNVCQNYCRDQGWASAKVYTEAPGTTSGDNQVELQQILTDVQAGRIDVVVVHHLDRLARDFVHVTETQQQIVANGARLVVVEED